ncbi:MAG: copper-binding protein [Bacteroidota bacterium]
MALLLAMGLLVGCGSDPEPDEVWTVRGVFEAPMLEGDAAMIRHEEVPGLMDAMRMDFLVADPREIEGLAPETPIEFEIAWTDGRTVARRFLVLPDTVSLNVPPPPHRF